MLSAVIKTRLKMLDSGIENKKALRRCLQLQRSHFSEKQASVSALQAARHILACDAYRKAKCIMGYLAFKRELSVDLVLTQALADKKQVVVPWIISDHEMKAAILHDMDNFTYDRYGIRSVQEPVQIVIPRVIDLILVPGVAFGRDGSRLGMGAGFYDRFLPQAVNAMFMGVAYSELLQEKIPCEQHDIYMDYLACESGIMQINRF